MGAQGAKVVVNYVNSAKAADEVVSSIESSGGSAIAVKAYASTIAGGKHLVDEAVKAFGGIDIVVFNAGIMGAKVLADVDEAFYDSHFATNVKGPRFLAKAAAPLLPTRATLFLDTRRLTLTNLFM
jgi:3-oxoacyl-[acyl-carrier protein] reductase